MPVKTIYSTDGRTFKLGRRHPMVIRPRLHLRNYLYKALPQPPATCDYTAKAAAACTQTYLNQELGCCVVSWIMRSIGIFTGNANSGAPAIASDEEVIAAYEMIGGYNPSNPSSDEGCDENDALNIWQTKGVKCAGQTHKIAGYVGINAADPEEVRTAIYLFENAMLGIPLPDAWVRPFPSNNATWDVVGDPDPGNGHCVGSAEYDERSITVQTWGEKVRMTNAAISKYCVETVGGQIFTAVSLDSIASGAMKAPNGFDSSQLLADLQSLS